MMKKLTVLLTIVLFYTTTYGGYAVTDYDWYSYNGHQYALTMEHSNWEDAEVEAVAVGGHLVTVNTEAERDWLVDLNANPFGDQYSRDHQGDTNHNAMWVGLEYNEGDFHSPSSWQWVNGDPITFWDDQFAYSNYTGIHMLMTGGVHWVGFGQFTNGPHHDCDPSQNLRGIIEVVPEPCSLILIGCGCFFLRGKRK